MKKFNKEKYKMHCYRRNALPEKKMFKEKPDSK